MSLFPAYSDVKPAEGGQNQDKEWLSNSSFGFSIITSVQQETNDTAKVSEKHDTIQIETKSIQKGQKQVKKVRKKKKKRKKLESCSSVSYSEVVSDSPDLYSIDKNRQLSFLNYKTLTKPLAPRYHISFQGILDLGCLYKTNKQKKLQRYYVHLQNETKQVSVTEEEQLANTKKVEEFNKKLGPDSDVSDWLEFIEFQDEYFRNQSISYNSEIQKKRAIFQKKLDILEKALSYNLKNEKLHKLWVEVGSEILSHDELLLRLEKMVKQSPEMLSLWLKLISVRQQSLALCTFSSVTELYKRAVNGLKSTRSGRIIDKDSNVLELLFHYCKFLDQCGQWEFLWTILKNNLRLNFGSEMNIDPSIEDQKVKDLENEIVCNEKQAIWVTWLRIEKLREGVHFLPVMESLDYPQRCVSLDDAMEFVLHFHRDINFKLILTSIMLLKVPLLPLNNTILHELLESASPWVLDSPEIILSSVFHSPATDIKIRYLRRLKETTRGPQYLRSMEGQLEFLELIQKTFQECLTFLEGTQRIAVALWWLRFNRWLSILEKNGLANLQVTSKKMKNFFKDFMKSAENRDNLLFYCEYGLFEYNQGHVEASIKTLRTLILSRPSVYHLNDEEDKAALCFVYKCLSEIYVAIGQPQNAIKVLTNLATGTSIDSNASCDSIALAQHKYELVSVEEIHEIKDSGISLEQLLIPHFSLEWVSCYMWFLALTKSTSHVKGYVDEVISALQSSDTTPSKYAREKLWETNCEILWTLDRCNLQLLTEVLKYGVTMFPNNLKILSLLASKKLEEHGLWWTLKQPFLSSSSILGCVMLICVALERQETDVEGLHNRLRALFQEILSGAGKLSSLIHCLRLKFLSDYNSIHLNVAQVNAIESCPWQKSVYVSSISAEPNKLMQLTDVMIEKELRIHVTPDEIQEMRD